jgi:nucleoside-diphosphate-sugar epimerase
MVTSAPIHRRARSVGRRCVATVAGTVRAVKVFVAGATGAIGRPLLHLLVADGHEVAGMTRSTARADIVAAAGAAPVVCDVFDADALTDAVVRFGPEVVIDELTDLPDHVTDIQASAGANARIRREGTRHLLAAAASAGVGHFLIQSVAWTLPDEGAAAVAEMERMVLDADGVVLRYGQFYGPGTYWEHAVPPEPRIHIDEAARRTVDALTSPKGVITLVEDPEARPVTGRAGERRRA